MIDDMLLDKFDLIRDLPVSEEMLGAYLEGNLDCMEMSEISSLMADSDSILPEIVSDVMHDTAIPMSCDVFNYDCFCDPETCEDGLPADDTYAPDIAEIDDATIYHGDDLQTDCPDMDFGDFELPDVPFF